MKTRIAIACQGGGSQTAFTAGVFQAFFARNFHKDYQIVSLSGSSGGAVCAFFAWLALQLQQDDCHQLSEFWHDNSALNRWELAFNDSIINYLKGVLSGRLPAYNKAPSANSFTPSFSHGLRREFSDFEYLLTKHADFATLNQFCNQERLPYLVVGACDVLSGRLRKFSSRNETISAKHLLASACIPNLFPAVAIGAGAYWDGLFSDNPPIDALIKPEFIGSQLPDEVWVIKIDSTTSTSIPDTPEAIANRKGQLEGNLSLFHGLSHLEFLNDLLIDNANRSALEGKSYLNHRYGLNKEIKIPKVFRDEADKPYHIPMIEMSPELQGELNYESKLDRNPEFIQRLISDGVRQGNSFLDQRVGK